MVVGALIFTVFCILCLLIWLGIEKIDEIAFNRLLERTRYSDSSLPEAELKELVFVAYSCSKISTSKACEILELDTIDFRQQWNEWVKENPRMGEIFDNFQYQQFKQETENGQE